MMDSKDQRIAAKGRHIALVIVLTMMAWLILQFLGSRLGLPGRYALLFDFAALAALVYAGINILKLRRLQREMQR
ncbi:MAG: DUF5337 domain-containing protein [Aestuariivita sp.]|nr:DUF5337 domain-containing protein [Aestuariivita sp.]